MVLFFTSIDRLARPRGRLKILPVICYENNTPRSVATRPYTTKGPPSVGILMGGGGRCSSGTATPPDARLSVRTGAICSLDAVFLLCLGFRASRKRENINLRPGGARQDQVSSPSLRQSHTLQIYLSTLEGRVPILLPPSPPTSTSVSRFRVFVFSPSVSERSYSFLLSSARTLSRPCRNISAAVSQSASRCSSHRCSHSWQQPCCQH